MGQSESGPRRLAEDLSNLTVRDEPDLNHPQLKYPALLFTTTDRADAISRVFETAKLRKRIFDELSERHLFVCKCVCHNFHSTVIDNPNMLLRAARREARSGPLSPFLDRCKDGLFDFIPFKYADMRITEDIPTYQFDYNTLNAHVSYIGYCGKWTIHHHSQSWGDINASLRKVTFQLQILVRVGQGRPRVGVRRKLAPLYKEHVIFSARTLWTLRDIFEVLFEVMERSLEEHVELCRTMFLAHREKGSAPVELMG